MIVVGTTLASYKLDHSELDWLTHATEMAASADITFFAALERDFNGDLTGFMPLIDRLEDLNGVYWWFALSDGREKITSANRLIRIVTGRNLIIEYALRVAASHVLFLDSDLTPPPDVIPKLLEVDHPVVGGNVSSYCQHGPEVDGYPFPVQAHWNTAACLLVQADVLHRVRWRHDFYPPHMGETDDPCFAMDAEAAGFGPTYVRKDVACAHRSLVPVEERASAKP